MSTEAEFGRAQGHLSSELLDLLSMSALEEPAKGKVQQHLEQCDPCRARWTEREEDRQRFTQYVFPRSLPVLEERLRSVPLWERVKQKWTLALPFAGLVAVTALLVVVLPQQPTEQESPYYGVKGSGPQLQIVALRGGGQLVPVENGTALAPGDRIRFLVDGAGAEYLIVASRDGAGNVTVYYPYDAALSAPVQGAGLQELPGAIELDAVKGRERVFAVFSDAPLEAELVRKALSAGEDPAALPGVREVVTKEFVKEAP